MIAPIERRQVLLGMVVLGGAGALAACSAAPAAPPSQSAAGTTPAAPSGALATTGQVPVGGGVIVESAGQAYAVTQPVAGTFACFSAVCPHQGCNCNRVADGTIDCPCHASRFDIATGAVVQGPAKSPLTPAPITVTGTTISLGA